MAGGKKYKNRYKSVKELTVFQFAGLLEFIYFLFPAVS